MNAFFSILPPRQWLWLSFVFAIIAAPLSQAQLGIEGSPSPLQPPPINEGEDDSTIVKKENLADDASISEINLDAVVRVEVETRKPNYRVPWNSGGMGSGNGTGFLVGPNRFLTNAHVVSDARLIYLKQVSDPQPFEARVLHVAHDCDLALLEIVDEDRYQEGFADVESLYIGGIPKLNTTVIAVGYPIGGERISVTRGIVSRIDFRGYAHSAVDNHLTIQIDAAINPGNSGGPVLQRNKVVGVAFQGYSGDVAQGTSYMIPVPVIKRFLTDVEDGSYDHYVDLATTILPILNPAQRAALGLPNDGLGVMVAKADAAGSAGPYLQTGDVLLSIDDFPIFSDGFIEIEGERVNLNEIIERKFAGDTVELQVQRDKEPLTLSIELDRYIPYLMQANTYDQKPNFVLYSGMQFQPLNNPLMRTFKIGDSLTRYYYDFYMEDELYRERPQPIVLTSVLPDSINTHVQPYAGRIVDSINGKKINVLQDVYDALNGDAAEDGKSDFHVIRLLNEERPVILRREEAADAHERINQQYNVLYDHRIEQPDILQIRPELLPEGLEPSPETPEATAE